ncbi:preprotein translocase subunit SecB [Vibrio owensii]|uniref:Preprotein translocase subunit SecB n=1 Tax=Vibrio owensii TaxID=696485 RepID=A0AAP9KC04_9VIBR|nr:protein-export chaperone SecB [Vibrio owensii]AYO16835.1 preprotein translocase subunit SecB [Vibrio owensii]QGH49000.1 preprotein translocase subunit SecB [Vibrio owensii]
MKLNLKNTRVENLRLQSKEDVTEDEFSFNFSDGYSADPEDTSFIVKFDLNIESVHGFEVALSFIGEFETDCPPSDEFKKSQFPVVNAPAIAYPYLRAFVSTLTLNSGYEPLMLPTVNFQALAKRKAEQSQ